MRKPSSSMQQHSQNTSRVLLVHLRPSKEHIIRPSRLSPVSASMMRRILHASDPSCRTVAVSLAAAAVPLKIAPGVTAGPGQGHYRRLSTRGEPSREGRRGPRRMPDAVLEHRARRGSSRIGKRNITTFAKTSPWSLSPAMHADECARLAEAYSGAAQRSLTRRGQTFRFPGLRNGPVRTFRPSPTKFTSEVDRIWFDIQDD